MLFRLLIIYTRFPIIYSRLYPFESVFVYLYQKVSAGGKEMSRLRRLYPWSYRQKILFGSVPE